jgi:FixJ family two-component response regulator
MHRSHDLDDTATVFVVDPDPTTAGVIREVLDGSGLGCEFFRSGRDFLATFRESQPGCLVLEQRIPDMSGLQLQHRLSASGCSLPLIFMTANTDVSTAVELMRGGAIHVLEKPPRAVELFNAIQEALALDRDRRHAKHQQDRLNDLTAALTRKERQVLELIATGRSSKGMASELELSVRAIELRRNSLMTKLGLRTSLELMRFAVVAHKEFAGRPSDRLPSDRTLVTAASA